jgi:hypothetical protein
MTRFSIILLIVFLIQLPNWYFILGRDAGGIDDSGNERWIEISDWMVRIFSFPIFYFVRDHVKSYRLAFLIYFVDLILIALIIHLVVGGVKRAYKFYS